MKISVNFTIKTNCKYKQTKRYRCLIEESLDVLNVRMTFGQHSDNFLKSMVVTEKKGSIKHYMVVTEKKGSYIFRGRNKNENKVM